MVLCLVIMSVVIVCMAVKIYLLKKTAKEISEQIDEKLSQDTNTVISVSTTDKDMCVLASGLNGHLKKLRSEYIRFNNGNTELKTAITNISHDLRTPLTAICGYLDLLEHEEKSEMVQRYLSQIENRTEALKGLTEELFRYSVVASEQDLKAEPLDVVQTLEDCLLSFYGIMQEKGIEPHISLPETAIYRNLDANAIGRIFSNIISNAMKYSDGDFSVTMNEDCQIVFVNSAKELNAVAVGRLFDRFYTVDAGRTSTGLGLSIAKLLTERMGGSISAEYCDDRLYIIVQFKVNTSI